ncbi:MAG: hypothetical protein JOZ51_26560 [Chloroflexi bacterium]|nr:hypothetical protein [Chloroflexota bacterium]
MHPVLKALLVGLLGVLCLLLSPVLIAIFGSLLLDMIGLAVGLLGLVLIVMSIVGLVRSARGSQM